MLRNLDGSLYFTTLFPRQLWRVGDSLLNAVLSPSQMAFTGDGGAGSVQVTVPTGRPWNATSGASWIAITAGSAGGGSGGVRFKVAVNNSGAARIGSLVIAGRMFTVHQAAASFKAVSGGYGGLVTGSEGISGFLDLKAADSGAFTAALRLEDTIWRFIGRFTAAGKFSATLRKRGAHDIQIELSLPINDPTEPLYGTLMTEGKPLAITAVHAIRKTAEPLAAGLVGRHTFALDAPSDPGAPQGRGHGTLVVSSVGRVRMIGRLGDDTVFSGSAVLDQATNWPFYLRPYRRGGFVAGILNFRVTGRIGGTLNWSKSPFAGAPIYPGGFFLQLGFSGERYGSLKPALEFQTAGNGGAITFDAGILGFDPPGVKVNLPDDGAILLEPRSAITLRIDGASGLFSGKVRHPDGRMRTPFRGVVLQQSALGAGLFKSNGMTGPVEIAPAP